ncbi:ABC transporter permease [Bacillus shivajii]|uniref:ABC transporter permease n=1 Tax=Bacillus shivajii TaxID=1983719 RepID=UPI001CF9B504|nr:ABC transporter permease [Bacillus shivajii]UCZ54327.1 ABC transporter permease [Bacillus shivajii]
MIEEKELWIKRRSDYWTMAIKYLRLIGNSGFLFTLYLLFLFGSYYYGEFLAWLPETFPATLFFTAMFTWMVTRGRVRTFAKQGDLFYLIPLEGRMSPYFRSSIKYSWMMETFWLALVFLILTPLFFDRIADSSSVLFSILILLSGLKLWNLASSFEEQRIQETNVYFLHMAMRLGLNGVAVFALFSLQSVWLIASLAFSLLLFYIGYFHRLSRTHSIKWDRLVDIENKTVMTFYRVANSFTDVPALKTTVKYRGWLSFLFTVIKHKKEHVYRYMFLKAFVRSNDYFGIYLRLTLLGVLFLSIVQLDWGRWLLAIIFPYMTALQLETVRNHFVTHQMIELYPIRVESKFSNHQFLIQFFGVLQAVIFGITVSIAHSLLDGGITLLFGIAVYAFHLNVRLKKVYEAN